MRLSVDHETNNYLKVLYMPENLSLLRERLYYIIYEI